MKLKSFKGMPHELGGIDYTEGAEVEGGEYAVKIGTSGNEYIFDKESSEGDFLAKEYKKLNSNSRLLEDDPIALATFEQIARDQALTHAQRSVNEKGVDPFRNMYEKGQAKNGGVKYATGGPVGYNMDESSEDRMRTTSFGDQEMRIEADTVNRKDIPAWKEAGLLMGDIFLTPVTSAFTGKSFSEMAMADSGYRSSEATRRAFGDDTMTGTAFGVGFAESEGVISNLGSQFFSKQGGALPKDKYAQGGASGQKDMYMGGGGYMQLFEGIHNVRQGSKQIAGPAIDNMYDDQRYVRQPIAGPPTTSGGGSLGIPQKQPQEEQGGLDPQYFDQEGNPWMMDEGQLTNMPVASESPDMITGDAPIDLGGSSAFGGFKNGGAKKGVYGYYANGGGIDTLHSGITYQDLQGGRSYPVYDNNGNEIQGRRNIGASSLSPGFDIQENFIPRESTPQGYVPVNHDPYGNYDLNEESHFMHLRKPPRQSKLTRDLNAEQGFNLYADPVKNAPNVKSTSTLINNETNESRPLKKKEFKPGGVNETDPPINVENIIAEDATIRQREIDAAHYQRLLQSGIIKNQEPYNSGTVDYPPTSFLSQNSPGSPNAQFMGNRQSQDFHNELIASELVGGVAGAGISRAATNLNRSNELQKLWRIQEKGAKPTAQLAKEGKLGKHFQNEQSIKHFNDREKHFGEWFTNDKKDLDWYTKDREFLNPEIIELNVPKSKLKNYQNYDKSLSRASDREFVIPLSEQKNYYANGGVKETDPPMGPTGAPTGVAVSPTGNAYSSEYMGGRNKKRGVGSNDYGMIPANMEQYAYTFFGGNKPFTEADMTPEEYKSAVDLYNIREKSHTIGYPDHDKVGSTNTSKAGMLSKLTNEPDIIRNLIGAAATKDGRITSDYNFGKKHLSEILKDFSLEDIMAWAHNNSPFVDKEAMAKEDAINIKMPKRKNNDYYTPQINRKPKHL